MDIMANIRLSNPVIIDESVTLNNLPTMISLLLI